MFRPKTILIVALGAATIWIYGHRLYEWLMTGELYLSSKFAPSQYVAFSDDHIGFVLGFSLYVFLIFAGLLVILSAIAEE